MPLTCASVMEPLVTGRPLQCGGRSTEYEVDRQAYRGGVQLSGPFSMHAKSRDVAFSPSRPFSPIRLLTLHVDVESPTLTVAIEAAVAPGREMTQYPRRGQIAR